MTWHVIEQAIHPDGRMTQHQNIPEFEDAERERLNIRNPASHWQMLIDEPDVILAVTRDTSWLAMGLREGADACYLLFVRTKET